MTSCPRIARLLTMLGAWLFDRGVPVDYAALDAHMAGLDEPKT